MACRNGRHYKIIVVSAILSTITGSESRGKNGCYVNFKSRYIALLFLRTISSINMNGILTLSVNFGDEVEEDDEEEEQDAHEVGHHGELHVADHLELGLGRGPVQ